MFLFYSSGLSEAVRLWNVASMAKFGGACKANRTYIWWLPIRIFRVNQWSQFALKSGWDLLTSTFDLALDNLSGPTLWQRYPCRSCLGHILDVCSICHWILAGWGGSIVRRGSGNGGSPKIYMLSRTTLLHYDLRFTFSAYGSRSDQCPHIVSFLG